MTGDKHNGHSRFLDTDSSRGSFYAGTLRHERCDSAFTEQSKPTAERTTVVHAERTDKFSAGAGIVKTTFFLVAIGLLALMLAGRLRPPPANQVTSSPTIEHLQPLASLVTTEVHVTDALTTSIVGKTGELRTAVIVHGDALISVDLTLARIEQLDEQNRTAVIILPPPHVVHARVDHDRTRIFDIEATGLWSIVPSDNGRAELLDQAMREAQAVIHRAAGEPNVISRSRSRAEQLICAFMKKSLSWSVDVRWIDSATD